MSILTNARGSRMVSRAFSKLVVGPLRYKRGGGYDAERYWRDRFDRHGRSLVAAGNEGLTELENQKAYDEARSTFLELCQDAEIDLSSSRVLEIGPGTGFYTALLAESGTSDYVGVDITDKLFPEFESEWPAFKFVKRDITSDALEGEHDVALMIDVLEHIVDREQLRFALTNIAKTLAPGGRFVVGPVYPMAKRRLFYVHWWTRTDVERMLEPLASVTAAAPFRGRELLVFRRSSDVSR